MEIDVPGEKQPLTLAINAALSGLMAYEQCVKVLTKAYSKKWVEDNPEVVLACMQAGYAAHLAKSLNDLHLLFSLGGAALPFGDGQPRGSNSRPDGPQMPSR